MYSAMNLLVVFLYFSAGQYFLEYEKFFVNLNNIFKKIAYNRHLRVRMAALSAKRRCRRGLDPRDKP